MAQHSNDLVFPFRRYQIQKVWRGERPQHGRFREFTQCDIDIVGDGKLSLMADAEIPAVISTVFSSLDIGDFTIRISNRKIPTGYLAHLGFDEEDASSILREADKIDRQGAEPLLQRLDSLSASASTADDILSLVRMNGSPTKVLDHLTRMSGAPVSASSRAFTSFERSSSTPPHSALPDKNIAVDLGIVRGLDYYTGTIYETRLDDHPQLGSIC